MSSPGFQSVVNDFYEPLFRFGYSLAGNRDDACDLVQQTFFIWARHRGRIRDVSKTKSWLFTTLYREYLKLHRHEKRMTPVESPELRALPEDETPVWISRLDIKTVLTALGAVDELFRVPLTLFYLEELSYKEIADALDIPIGTVMSRLARGKEQIKRFLASEVRREEGTGPAPALPGNHRRSDHG